MHPSNIQLRHSQAKADPSIAWVGFIVSFGYNLVIKSQKGNLFPMSPILSTSIYEDQYMDDLDNINTCIFLACSLNKRFTLSPSDEQTTTLMPNILVIQPLYCELQTMLSALWSQILGKPNTVGKLEANWLILKKPKFSRKYMIQ